MWNFFLSIWNKRPHYSELSGKWLGGEALSIFFHHCAEKELYPDAALWEDNIILVTFEEHQEIHSDGDKWEKVRDIRNKIIEKLHIE